jgi:hypothetical protein
VVISASAPSGIVLPESHPAVYFAGPIDYVEHRSTGDHLRDNWRHRFFGDLAIDLLCPTCLNRPTEDGRKSTDEEIMERNRAALRRAKYLVAYFPGDVATFGTPLEVKTFLERANLTNGGHAILIHPARPGVFVRWYEAQYGLLLHKDFIGAREELRHLLWRG